MERQILRERALSNPAGRLDRQLYSPEGGGDERFDFLLRRPSAIRESLYEESLLSLGAAMTASEFRNAVCEGLHATLSHVLKAYVILIDQKSDRLSYLTGDGSVKPLPHRGLLWKVVRHRAMEMTHDAIPSNDPLCEIMGITDKKEGEGIALLYPVLTKSDNSVVAVSMALCDEPTSAQLAKFEWLMRNTLVAGLRVLKHTSAEQERIQTEGMLEVCGSLIDLDTTQLTLKILKHVKSQMHCKQCLLFIVDKVTSELVCQVFEDAPLEKEIRLNITDSIFGRCVLSEEVVIVDDSAADARINPSIDFINNYEPCTMLCLPVYSSDHSENEPAPVIGVAAVLDKIGGKTFAQNDVETMQFILRFSSSMLSNTLLFQHELALKQQNQALLQVARTLFTSLDDSQVLLHAVMEEARNLIKAEKCSLFLVEKEAKELVAVVFDSIMPGRSPGIQETFRIPIGQGIAGYVAESGETVNIKDAYKHPKFYQKVDKTTGFRTRNILCIPICDNTGIVGVAELMNKIGGRYFTSYDEELAKAFSVYCGISIYHSILYNDIVKEQSRSRLATELMIYHMQIPTGDVNCVSSQEIPDPQTFAPEIGEYHYSPRKLPENGTLTLIISMMQRMDMINKWKIPRDTLARFVLMVRKGYRDTPYHNWWHALSVTHFFYVLDQKCQILSLLTDLEQLALFVSCLCHDIDHRGTNNAFQVSSNSVLASVYSSEGSVMERHHLAQTLCILNTERCNIFQNLPPMAYKEALALVQSNILATDIASHLKMMKKIEGMAQTGYDRTNPTHHELLSSLLMTSCDLSNACKDWETTKLISELIYDEFFSQGDLEKALGVTPSAMMDRDKAFIPEQQLGFLDGIAIPLYKVLSQIFPDTITAYRAVLENRALWEKLKNNPQ